MIFEHKGVSPRISQSAFIAPTATVCGDVTIGKNCRIMYGAAVIAEGGTIVIGDDCVVLENAVLRSTDRHNLSIGNGVLIGPQAHVVGSSIEDGVFVATGASIFHGAIVGAGSEVRIHAVVHLKTTLPENSTVPIGWIAVGNPVEYFPPEKHEEIWKIQKELDFPMSVYGVDRSTEGVMRQIMGVMTKSLGTHVNDKEVGTT